MDVEYYAGVLGGGGGNYNNWPLNINNISSNSTQYITSVLTDIAIDWISNQTQPWFLWLAHIAPHTPFHEPPDDLHSLDSLNGMVNKYFAAIEALDTETGRLLASMSEEERENTIIIFIGDNGTPGQVVQNVYHRQSLHYQDRYLVPMKIVLALLDYLIIQCISLEIMFILKQWKTNLVMLFVINNIN